MKQKQALSYASGPILYNMTNDYMFRYILQENESILKAFLASLLHLNEREILSIKILNPIFLGDTVDQKNFLLDIRLKLNDNQLINLEMQVINRGDWTDRSLSYICRQYDSLNKGDNYTEALSVRHIGIIDFNLFEDDTEFYSTYYIKNDKTGRIYNSKFIISVLNLKQINNATDEDRSYNIDTWASLFKAGTWEELKMIADNSKNDVFKDTAQKIYNANNYDAVLERCQARQDYIYWENRAKYRYKKIEEENTELKQYNSELLELTKQLQDEIAKLKSGVK